MVVVVVSSMTMVKKKVVNQYYRLLKIKFIQPIIYSRILELKKTGGDNRKGGNNCKEDPEV